MDCFSFYSSFSHFRDDSNIMPRCDGRTLRDFLRAGAGAEYIMATRWNEWRETTVVEPSSTGSDPYLYLKILAEWKGRVFSVPPPPEIKGKEKS